MRCLISESACSNKENFYCFTHGWDKGQNSNGCRNHNSSATTHVGMGGNPAESGRTVTPPSRGLVGYAQARAMATGTTQKAYGSTCQANSVIQPAMVAPTIQQPMMAPMMM